MFNCSQTTKDENVTISSLSFTPTIVDSGKFLTCRVGSSPHIVEDGWKLNIHRKYTLLDISLKRTGEPHFI